MASDHPAGNHFPGIAGGLAGEIIGVPVDNDGSSADIFDLDPGIIKCSPGDSFAAGEGGYCPQAAADQKIKRNISGRILEHRIVLFHLGYDTEKKR